MKRWMLLLGGIALASAGWAQNSQVIVMNEAENGEGEEQEAVQMEMAPYLGISTAPVQESLGAQLGLPRGAGLIVTMVDPKSPAAGKLEVNDVVQKVNDQVLFNGQQFSALIRTLKAGDEVTLTVFRKGKASTVTAKLAEKKLPKLQAGGWTIMGGGAGMPLTLQIGVPSTNAAGAGVRIPGAAVVNPAPPAK